MERPKLERHWHLVTRSTRSLSIALLSAAGLAYEVLLVRIFAIEYFHHLAFMAVGVAMLGFGASGTLLALQGRLPRQAAERWFAWGAVLAAVTLVASPALAQMIPLDATQIAVDPGEWLRLGVVYLFLALPFAAVAVAILTGIVSEPGRPGTLYGASFLGSGLGSGLAVVMLWFVFPERALAVPAVVGALGAVTAARRAHPFPASLAWTSIVVSGLVLARPLWRLDVTPYKGLPQVEAYPDARRVIEHTSPVGWVVAVDAPAFRHAPGLSLRYRGEFPKQTGLFVDGELAGSVVDWMEDTTMVEVLHWLPSALPYALGERQRVLVLGAGGGQEVWSAIAHDARTVTAVELHPELARLAKEGGFGNAEVEWVVGDARHHVARSRQQFDLITLGTGGRFGAATAGMHSLNEDFLHTVEAYAGYIDHLAPDGLLAITRWLAVPPRESIRVILTAARALRRVAPDAADRGLFVMRSWATATVLIKPSGFTPDEIDALTLWATSRGFDVDWHPDLESPTMRFNFLDEPVLFQAAAAGASGPANASRFASAYSFDVAPVDDARPYPHHFLRASAVGAFLRSSRGTWLPFAEWGYVALIATLFQSVVLAGLLMIVPAAVRHGVPHATPLRPVLGYFTAIGLAYLSAEIAAIQQLSLLLGHPVYAVAAVLTTFLICSGIGSVRSDSLEAGRGWIATMRLAGLLLIYAVVLIGLVHVLQPFHLAVRVAAGVVAVGPVAFLMGLPFPIGLRVFTGDDTLGTAWAWAANGFASVVAAPLAALIAFEAGSRAVFLFAGGAYAVAAVIHKKAGLQQSAAAVPAAA